MRTQPGIVQVKPFSKDESARLLEPWLGSGLSIDQLPVPRVIVARVQPGTTLDLAACAGGDAGGAVGERRRSPRLDRTHALDDRRHRVAGIGILVLVIAATIISVSFATRGAMAANRPIVEVLHFVGAGDRYIANHFLRHFLRLGLEGGLIGGGAAMLGFGFSESIAAGSRAPPSAISSPRCWGRFRCRPRAIWRSRYRRWRSPPLPPGPRGERCSPRWTISMRGPMAFCSEARHGQTGASSTSRRKRSRIGQDEESPDHMALQHDDSTPRTPAARPRGWLRAAIVGAMAILFVGAAVGFVAFLSQLRGVEIKPARNADGSWC
jgi:hypothetical protein